MNIVSMYRLVRHLILILTIALFLTGLSHAYWSETLTIRGTVKTGELELGFMKCLIYVGLTNNYVTLEPINPPKNEWQIHWKRLLFGIWLDTPPDTIAFRLDNTYPCFGSTLCPIKPHSFLFIAKFMNIGTIPAKLDHIEVEKPDWIEIKGILIIVGKCKVECKNIDTNRLSNDLETLSNSSIPSSLRELREFIEEIIGALESSNDVNSIINRGGLGYVIMRLHVKQNAPESSEDTIAIRLVFKQWNA